MRNLLICMCFLATDLHSLMGMPQKEYLANGPIRSRRSLNDRSNEGDIAVSISDGAYVSNNCLAQSISIDRPENEVNHHDQRRARTVTPVTSSRRKIAMKAIVERESGEAPDQSASLKPIQVVFTIPYAVVDGSIINQTVLITDAQNDEITPSFKYVCVNSSSFVVHYLTNKPLPHNVCLYVVLNRTSTTAAREIFTCRTIGKDHADHDDKETDEHVGGPSFVFIISLGILILMLMLFISIVHTVRKRRLINRVSQRLLRGFTTPQTIPENTSREMIELRQRGARSRSIEERVLAATDLTTTQNDRTPINRALLRISELTRRLHA